MGGESPSPSEAIFAGYLRTHGIAFTRDHIVSASGRNVDFFINGAVYADVKEVCVRPKTKDEIEGGIVAAAIQIRGDIKKLRTKFDPQPTLPVVLVTMNYSDNIFTGFEVATAMLGDAGVIFLREDPTVTWDLHHLPRGHATLTEAHNTSISGVLVFDLFAGHHAFFSNPFASIPLRPGYFPGAHHVELTRDLVADDVRRVADLTFFSGRPR